MASPQSVQSYLAYWMQLGKGVTIANQAPLHCPQVVMGDRYSPAFTACWEQITTHEGNDCYLEGSEIVLADLFSEQWEITPCYRCALLIPQKTRGIQTEACPCSDLPSWPNLELPQPRKPVNNGDRLAQIRQRLTKFDQHNDGEMLSSHPAVPQMLGLYCALELHSQKERDGCAIANRTALESLRLNPIPAAKPIQTAPSSLTHSHGSSV